MFRQTNEFSNKGKYKYKIIEQKININETKQTFQIFGVQPWKVLWDLNNIVDDFLKWFLTFLMTFVILAQGWSLG